MLRATMMLRRTVAAAAGLALSAILMVGCAGPWDGGLMPDYASPSAADPSAGASANPFVDPSVGPYAAISPPPMSSTDLPTLKPPSAPPKTPTDLLPTDLIVGIVTAGGTGPCYGMETNEGQQYALYGGGGISLQRGDTIRVKVEPLKLKIYCGPGVHVNILKIEIVS